MEYKSKFQVVVFAYLLILLFVGSASSATLIVDKYRTGNYTTGNYTTIQAAVNNASDGDTVYVHSETYYEHVTVNKRIILVGANQTVIDGSGSGSCIYVTTDKSEIIGFTVQNGRWGIYLCSVRGCKVDRNNFVNNSEWDIYSDNSKGNHITNNRACSIRAENNELKNNKYLHITSYDPPDLTPSIREGEPLEFSVDVPSSKGNVSYTWTLDDVQQSTSNRCWSYTPDYNTVTQGRVKKTVVNVTVVSDDDKRCEVTKEWKVTVKDYNPPPTIIRPKPSDRSPCIKEGKSLEFSVSVNNPDGRPPRYKWFLDGDLKESPHSNWTYWPKDTDVGTKIVKVTVIDAEDDTLTDSHDWVVTICNREPTIDSFKPDNRTPRIEEGKSLIFSVTAHDPEGSGLIYKWTLDKEEVLSSGENFWIYSPNYTASGTRTVNLTVSDRTLTTTKEWTVDVIDVNQAPIIHSFNPERDIVNMSYNASRDFDVDASDPDEDDNDKLAYTWTLDEKKIPGAERFNFSPETYFRNDTKNVTTCLE